MKFTETKLPGAYPIDVERRDDDRGFFARAFCEREFGAYGLEKHVVQINNSMSLAEGTLRGMHYQLTPSAEVKVVRCIHGALWDAIIDVRPRSPTFGKWFGAELTAKNRRMMYVPQGFAHGFVTLSDHTEMLYFVTEYYSAQRERCIRWNDSRFGIDWPVEPVIISEKDRTQTDFDP